MGYPVWPLVLFLFVSPTTVQGDERCLSNNWLYHEHTYTCFVLIRESKTWEEARDHCAGIVLRSDFGVTTRLAKIDDWQTNKFLQDTFYTSTTTAYWIGLHKNGNGEFRWDGYPDEVQKFRPINWRQPDRQYLSLLKTEWRGENSDVKRLFFCQQEAKKIGEITCVQQPVNNGFSVRCTSEASPVGAICRWRHKDGGSNTFGNWNTGTDPSPAVSSDTSGTGVTVYTTVCTATLGATLSTGKLTVQMQMYPDLPPFDLSTISKAFTNGSLEIDIVKPGNPTFYISTNQIENSDDVILVQGTENVNVTCSVLTGNPFVYTTRMTCDNPINNGNQVTSTSGQSYHATLIVGQVRRNMDGKKCTCFGSHVTGSTETSTLTFRVVAKPADVVCESDLKPEGLRISCRTDKVYPKASCVFSYRQGNEGNFIPLPATNDVEYQHEMYTDTGDVYYYKSNCSVTLTVNDMILTSGNISIQATINPDVAGIDRDSLGEAFRDIQQTVYLEPPNQPIFIRPDRTSPISSPILYAENASIDLSCQVNTGRPLVNSVTLSCDFPFDNSNGNNEHTTQGTHYVIEGKVSRDMNGKNCTCTGNHLTGSVTSSPLTFDVTYPADVTDFTVGGMSTVIEVEVNDSLTLSCMADGNPSPSVRVVKLNDHYVDTSNWQSDASESQVERDIVAQCIHNGRYKCSASNTMDGQMASKELDIRVTCPPTFCDKSVIDFSHFKLGTSEILHLCVVGYPMPLVSLYKNSDSGWTSLESFSDGQTTNDTLTIFDSQQRLTIGFPSLQASHLGSYSLNYTFPNGTQSSALHFRLTAPPSHCNGDRNKAYEVNIGQTTTLTMCMAAFPVPSSLWMQKDGGTGWHNYTNGAVDIAKNDEEVDNLMTVKVTLNAVKAIDLGRYRLLDPDSEIASSDPYLYFTVNERVSDDGSDDIGIIVGAVVAAVVLIIILIVVVFVVKRWRRSNYKRKNGLEASLKDRRDINTVSDVISYDNYIYGSGSGGDTNDVSEKEVDENHYDNEPEIKDPIPEDQEPEKKTDRKENELVYSQVVFDQTSHSKPKSQKQKESRKSTDKEMGKTEGGKEEESVEEATEYVDISGTETLKLKMELEEEKHGLNDKDSGEDMGVYVNVNVEDKSVKTEEFRPRST